MGKIGKVFLPITNVAIECLGYGAIWGVLGLPQLMMVKKTRYHSLALSILSFEGRTKVGSKSLLTANPTQNAHAQTPSVKVAGDVAIIFSFNANN